MNLTEYILLPREERTAHIDLSMPCDIGRRKKQKNARLFKRLCEMLSVEIDIADRRRDGGVHTCHLCNDGKCHNPRHAYIGTASENTCDIPGERRSAIAKKRESELSDERRAEKAEKLRQAVTRDHRSESAQRGWSGISQEDRSELAKAREVRMPPEVKERRTENAKIKNQKAVELKDMETGETYRFHSVKMASDTLKIDRTGIARVCQGRQRSTYGFTARYL